MEMWWGTAESAIIGRAEQLRQSVLVQKVIGYVSKGAIATLFVIVPYILWPF